jgi:hypothetical protein
VTTGEEMACRTLFQSQDISMERALNVYSKFDKKNVV